MATSREREAELFSSSPAHPSHTRSVPSLQLQKQQQPPQDAPQQRKNPLKRSASTASLLTPPGSPEKEKLHQYRSKGDHTVTEDEFDEDEDYDTASPGSPGGKQRARSLGAKPPMNKPAQRPARIAPMGIEGVGRIFMAASKGAGAAGSSKVHPLPLMAQPSFVPTARHPALEATKAAVDHIDKMNLDSDSDASPLLPATPQANQPVVSHPSRLPLPPAFRRRAVTPPRRAPKRKTMDKPMRDSPNNPFLSNSPPRQKAPQAMEEKPTLTYVFRGVKAVFRNPAYGVVVPGEGHPSTLPAAHPDFSPDLHTLPKLLFTNPPLAGDQDSENDDDEVEERLRIRPKRLFGEDRDSGRNGRGRGSNKRIKLETDAENPFASTERSISLTDRENSVATLAKAHGPARKPSF